MNGNRLVRRTVASVAIALVMATFGSLVAPAQAVHQVGATLRAVGTVKTRSGPGHEYPGPSSDALHVFSIDAVMPNCIGIGCNDALFPAVLDTHGEFYLGTLAGKDPCFLGLADGPLRIRWANGAISGGRLQYVFTPASTSAHLDRCHRRARPHLLRSVRRRQDPDGVHRQHGSSV